MKKVYPIVSLTLFIVAFITLIYIAFHNDKATNQAIYAKKINLQDELYTHKTFFTSPKFDLQLIYIADEDFDYFMAPPVNTFFFYPLNKEIKNQYWKTHTWKSTPISLEDKEFYIPAMDATEDIKFVDKENRKKIKTILQEMDVHLEEVGSYYAFYYNEVNRDEVELYLISPINRMIWRVYYKP